MRAGCRPRAETKRAVAAASDNYCAILTRLRHQKLPDRSLDSPHSQSGLNRRATTLGRDSRAGFGADFYGPPWENKAEGFAPSWKRGIGGQRLIGQKWEWWRTLFMMVLKENQIECEFARHPLLDLSIIFRGKQPALNCFELGPEL
jgi:hypothetical protein